MTSGTAQLLDRIAFAWLRRRYAEHVACEGMVTVWDDQGRYLGCMGVETWKRLLFREALMLGRLT